MTASKLRDDERGAIMIIGLFMAFALIGALWFLLGIGATLALREKMQQAADSAAFSAAAVHARDMNIIVGINIVMFILASVWLILSITYTVIELVSVYLWLVAIASCLVGCEGVADAEATDEVRQYVKDMKDDYENVLNWMLPALSTAQDAIAEGAFLEAGALTMANVLTHAKNDGFIGFGFSADTPTLDGPGQVGKRVGLPIESEKNSALCNHAVQWTTGYLESLLLKFPIFKQLTEMDEKKKLAFEATLRVAGITNPTVHLLIDRFEAALSEARKLLSTGLTDLYCSGGVWDKTGPKRMWRPDANKQDKMEKNASDWMQVYGITFVKGSDDNDAERKIGIAGRQPQVHTDRASFKYAQAEYFFDCEGTWASGECNSITDEVKDTGIDASMYRMQWRARLVRVHLPKNLPGRAYISGANSLLSERAIVKQKLNAMNPELRETLDALPSSIFDFLNAMPAGNFH